MSPETNEYRLWITQKLGSPIHPSERQKSLSESVLSRAENPPLVFDLAVNKGGVFGVSRIGGFSGLPILTTFTP